MKLLQKLFSPSQKCPSKENIENAPDTEKAEIDIEKYTEKADIIQRQISSHQTFLDLYSGFLKKIKIDEDFEFFDPHMSGISEAEDEVLTIPKDKDGNEKDTMEMNISYIPVLRLLFKKTRDGETIAAVCMDIRKGGYSLESGNAKDGYFTYWDRRGIPDIDHIISTLKSKIKENLK